MGSTSRLWRTGWAAGAAVVAVAAGLLLEIITRGRRIARQAEEIAATLKRAHGNSTGLFDLTQTNAALEHTVDGVRGLREGGTR